MLIITLLATLLAYLPADRNTAPSSRWLVETTSSDADCLERWYAGLNLGDAGLDFRPLPVEGWWVVEVPEAMAESLGKLPCVARLFPDRPIEWRRTPNDPAYINQADMNLMGMPGAWDITTGGLTALGDTIVVAVIDQGFQVDHEDLVDNIWLNHFEIPGDGIDNDLNGYVDDHRGYSVVTDNDAHTVNSHGTSVCGIIGARGNNGKGVAGVNWQVKLMLVSGADFESRVIESYQYILEMRKDYRETNGARGAFVVAANLSGGINNAWAVDHPLWCQMYDRLGEEGILGICAAPNNPISVDLEGDMPTTCTSPYMIAVTNVDLTDALVGNAGFGVTSIDIGAPGHGTITAASPSQYREFPGTSAATPHVAGLVALLYSTDCPALISGVSTDPEQVAERVRDMVYQTARQNNSLAGMTATGRRVQADAAVRAAWNLCGGGEPANLSIDLLSPNPAGGDNVRVFFTAEVENPEGLRIDIYSATGVRAGYLELSENDLENGYIDLDTRSLPAAVYQVTLWNGRQKSTRSLVVL